MKNLLDEHNIGPKSGTELFVMVELPSNVIEADRFMEMMDLAGGSIGSNDLVQTVYAVSRDDLEGYQNPVDARSPAVKSMIRDIVRKFNAQGLEIGICGQAPLISLTNSHHFLSTAGLLVSQLHRILQSLLGQQLPMQKQRQKSNLVGFSESI